MRQQPRIALLIALATAAPTWAAGPYQVFRVGAASSVTAPSAPLVTLPSPATVTDPSLGDGLSYFYFVRDGQGASLHLALTANRGAGAVELTFDGTGTLRDDAIGSLHDLFGPAGLLATMEAAAAGTGVAAALHRARLDGLAALDELAVNTGERDDNAVKTWLDRCLRMLDAAKADPSPFTASQIAAIEQQVLEIARMLATYRFELAVGICGPCSQPGTPVCQAQAALAHANTLKRPILATRQVVDAYGAAINFSLQAAIDCN